MILYLIANAVTGKRYVGITTETMRKRFAKHVWDARHGNARPLASAMRKYGVAAFSIEQIGSAATFDDLKALEVEAIVEWGTLAPRGYNATEGGDGIRGHKFSDGARAKMSAAHKGKPAHNRGKPMSDAQKEKLRAASKSWIEKNGHPLLGVPRTAETRAKLSAAGKGRQSPNKGKTWSATQHAKFSASRKGKSTKPCSPETRAKISAANRGRRFSAEHRLKLSAAHIGKPSPNRGRPMSAEQRAKISATKKAQFSNRGVA